MSCPNCQRIETELQRLRDAFNQDADNFARDIAAKNREIGALKKDNARHAGEEPEAQKIQALLEHWMKVRSKRANTIIEPGGKRWKVARHALKLTLAAEKKADPVGAEDRAYARCLNAITGLAMRPWHGVKGRSANPYPGAILRDDIEHALGDEKRQAECEQIAVAPCPQRPLHEQDHWLVVRNRALEAAVEHLLAEACDGDWPQKGTPYAGSLAVLRATLGRPVAPWVGERAKDELAARRQMRRAA